MPTLIHSENTLVDDLRSLIDQSRRRVATVINSEITPLYWAMGNRMLETGLADGRADYGKQVIRKLSQQLTAEFGKGFSPANLTNSVELARQFSELTIIQTLSEQFTWSHLVTADLYPRSVETEFLHGNQPVGTVERAHAQRKN